ncbi:hypothetical protein N7474_010058 [Penicillium riverlandense]|uniref:uncharacterized protein n=1 Tax=Penicillium riverlandense TaxID=1903569 RepID=UPI0025476E9E|nr:uncharacterized protein N7474_010058 [Penicillium riverlandense]KAJ5808789.1 hypothetical protein N7474_010058 [Penicillium riverlandense]
MTTGCGVLYNFCGLHAGIESIGSPRALVQRLLFHLLHLFPEVLEKGDRELFNAEIFIAAKSDLDISWRIFLECFRVVRFDLVYIVVEGIDWTRAANVNGDFRMLVDRFKDLSAPEALEQKKLKVMITSTRPDGGADLAFGSSSQDREATDTRLLLRTPRVAERSRREFVHLPSRKRISAARRRPLAHSEASQTVSVAQSLCNPSDFIPSDHEKGSVPSSAMDSYGKESDSGSEFDIFERPSKQKEEAEQKKICRRV